MVRGEGVNIFEAIYSLSCLDWCNSKLVRMDGEGASILQFAIVFGLVLVNSQ